jgi:RNA polymerase primary sigma factor
MNRSPSSKGRASRSERRRLSSDANSDERAFRHEEGIRFVARRPPLAREEEKEFAMRIERANRTMLDALTRSPVAMSVFAAMIEEFGDGCPECAELLSGYGRRELAAREILNAMHRETSPVVDSRSESRSDGAPTRFVNTVMRYGLTRVGMDELLKRLEGVCNTCQRSERRALDAALSTIRANHRVAEQAKAVFVEANIPLVLWMAARKNRGGLTTGDLFQEGCLGLIRAVEKFDHRRDIKFSTYAVWWIRQSMNRALSDQSRTIRLPVHLVEAKHKAARLAQRFSQEHGRDPSERDLSEQMGLTTEKVRSLFTAPKEPISLEAPLGPDTDVRVGDAVTDRDSTSPVDEIFSDHVRRRLRCLLDTLPARHAEVLRLRYGIDRPEGLTLQQVGERFSISRERTRQIEVEALAKLKERVSAEGIDSPSSN